MSLADPVRPVRYRPPAATRQGTRRISSQRPRLSGVAAAGVASFAVALIPDMVIGGAAVLAPRYLPRLRLPSLFRPTGRTRAARKTPVSKRPEVEAAPAV